LTELGGSRRVQRDWFIKADTGPAASKGATDLVTRGLPKWRREELDLETDRVKVVEKEEAFIIKEVPGKLFWLGAEGPARSGLGAIVVTFARLYYVLVIDRKQFRLWKC
jgi:hypothetical protein